MPPLHEDKKPDGEDKKTIDERISELETALAAAQARAPLTLIPEHGAGPGMTIAETWSQTQQERAIRGDNLTP